MKTKLKIFLVLFSFIVMNNALSAQCDTGSEDECTCESAVVLCSINELDGYTFSMSSFQHPNDGPDPLCNGGGVPNNPTWFSFIAWCEELEITVSLSNCTNPGPPNFFGAQVGIYSDCNSFNEIECENNCGNEEDKVLDLDGLTIGEVYYFLIDGCGGSACDVEISVVGNCTEEIEDWNIPLIEGDTEVCVDDDIDYSVEELTGATDYHWYIDGNEESVTNGPDNTLSFDSEGSYELCVDVSNECIDVDEEPMQICQTINVSAPDAGMLTATPNPLCPGEFSDVEVTGHNTNAGYEEVLIVVDPTGEVLDVITNSTTAMVTYDLCGEVTVYSLNYPVGEMIDIPAIGENYSGSDCEVNCCDETEITIDFEDEEDPEFTNPPADISLVCFDEIPPFLDLDVTDNCTAPASVAGTEDDNSDMCDGGIIEREWEFTDDCGNRVVHVQSITIEGIPEPEYVNPPGDVEIDCAGMIPAAIDLNYTNMGMGACLIDGLVAPTVDGMFDLCGSSIDYEWDFTDFCGNNINHIQTIEILPAEEAEFVNPPQDLVLSCEDMVPTADPLFYTNGDSGACLLEGFSNPDIDGSFDPCGTIISYEWEYTDPCGNSIVHEQRIEILPSDEPEFINPPQDITITCDEFNNFTFDDLDYTNSMSGSCEISGTVMPMISDNTNECGGTVEAEYDYTDDCGRNINHIQTVTVEPPAMAEFLSMPADITVNCDEIPAPAVALQYSNEANGVCLIAGSVDPDIDEDLDECGGTITNVWEYEDDCGRVTEHTQVITIEPAPMAEFLSMPADMTMDCSEYQSFDPETLDYTNNEMGICLIEGDIDGEEDTELDECGGIVNILWEFTDDCGRTIEHIQTLTVEPAPMAEFVNPPADITLDCSEVNEPLEFLEYDNEESGNCRIQGFIEATSSGVVDECGGSLTMTWTFVDNCNRLITESQTIDYLPAEEPEFNNPPDDMLLDCDEDVPEPEPLEYENGLDSPCEIAGEVDPELEVVDNIYTYTWTFTNPCTGFTIEHIQTIEKLLPVELEEYEFEFDICQGNEFDLSTIDLFDLNNTLPDFTYHDDLPPEEDNEIDPEIILNDEYVEYYIAATNNYGCMDIATIIFNAEEEVYAGEDIEDEFCIGTELMDLYSFLEGTASTDGEFTQIDGPELDFSFGDEIDVSEAEPDFYTFEYYVESGNSCPDDMSIMVIELVSAVDIELLSIECAPDGQSYNVIITNDSYDIDISAGDIESETNSQVSIINIPITDDITITAQDPGTRCESEFTYNNPDCACPMVSTPVSSGNFRICIGEDIPTLSVTTGVDEIAHWYDSATGGNLLISNSLEYTPSIIQAGTYTFYVEAESTIQTGCYSPNRIAITLEVSNLPNVTDGIINKCNYMGMGIESFTRTELIDALNASGNNLLFDFFPSLDDLEQKINNLMFPYLNETAYNQSVWVLTENSAGCQSINEIELRIDSLPELTALATDETCFEENNGSIALDLVSASSNTIVVNNNETLSTLSLINLEPGIYQFIAIDSLQCRDTLITTIEEGLQIEISELTFVCSDNGTSTDNSDDFYEVSIEVTSLNGLPGGTYTLTSDDGNINSAYSYNQVYNFIYPITNDVPTLTVTDVITGCTIEDSGPLLIPCSTDCQLIINAFDYECDNNGTGTDGSDDLIQINFNVSVINGGTSNTYDVIINNMQASTFSYDSPHSFLLPADGSVVSISIQDSDIPECFSDLGDITLDHCSNDCLLESTLVSTECGNNGTLESEDDDVFTTLVSMNALNASDSVVLQYNNQHYAYSDLIEIPDVMISVDSIILIFNDLLDPLCTDTLIVYAPLPCSEPCTIELLSFNIQECFNNNTPNNEDDDIFEVSFTLTSSDGVVSTYVVTDDMGNQYGPYNYDEEIVISNLAADGTNISFEFMDLINGTCYESQTFSQEECSDVCTISAQIVDIECDDAGTLDVNEDDLYNVSISVTEINGSATGFTGSNGLTGLYNEIILLQNQLISDGELMISITDNDNAVCFTEISITPPSPCSQPCTMEFVEVEMLECNDNNSPTDGSDDFFSVSFIVSVTDGLFSTFRVEDNLGNVYGPFEYNQSIDIGPFNSDGTLYILEFYDEENTTCNLEFSAMQESCSDLCVIEAEIVDVLCTDNGTPETNDDDLYNLDLLVNVVNGSSTYSIPLLSVSGSYGVNNQIQNLLISDGPIDLVIVDELDLMCTTNIQITPPQPCSRPCELILNDLVVSPCNNNGTGEDDTDDFYSVSINISGTVGNSLTYNITNGVDFLFGPINYDETVDIGPFSADGNLIELMVQDLVNDVCELNLSFSADPCSSCDQTLDIDVDNMVIDCENTSSNIELITSEVPLSIVWSGPNVTGSNEPVISVTQGGIFNVEVEFENDCRLSETIQIDERLFVPEIVLNDYDELDCEQVSVLLDAQMTVVDINTGYEWFNESGVLISTATEVEVTEEGVYTLVVTDLDSKCSSQEEIVVSSNLQTPTAEAFTNDIINCVNGTALLDGSASTLTNNTSIEWRDENGDIISTDLLTEVSQAGSYFLTLTDELSKCPSNVVEVRVIEYFNTPIVEILANPGNIFDCIIQTIALSTVPEPNTIYSWIINNEEVSNEIEIEVSNPSDVTLIALDTVSFCSEEEILSLDDFTEYPLIEVLPFETLNCDYDEVCIEITTQSFSQELYIAWKDINDELLQENTFIYCTDEPGTYVVEITDTENGCTNMSMAILEAPVIPEGSLPELIDLSIDQNYQLNPQLNISTSEIQSIEWISESGLSCYDCLNPRILEFEDGDVITVIITSDTGCDIELSTRVRYQPIKIPSVYIPNVFSPNDGQNFTIFTSEEITLIQNMYIYDRWGELVYTNQNFMPNDPDLGWDGSFNDGQAEQGVYVYLFIYELNGRLVRDYGDVTLLW